MIISSTLLFQYFSIAKAVIEQMRPWMILRKTDISKTVTAGNTSQTSTDFSRFYETETSAPIKLFDGSVSTHIAKSPGISALLEGRAQHVRFRRGDYGCALTSACLDNPEATV
jgi:hypothetical protein